MNKLDTIGGYWTVGALAEALGVSYATLESYISRHRVPVTKIGNTPLLRLDDLGQYRAKIANVRKLIEAGK